jgi:hypothetical protein
MEVTIGIEPPHRSASRAACIVSLFVKPRSRSPRSLTSGEGGIRIPAIAVSVKQNLPFIGENYAQCETTESCAGRFGSRMLRLGRIGQASFHHRTAQPLGISESEEAETPRDSQ